MNRTYYPDNWVIVEIVTSNDKLRKVLAGWKGTLSAPDSWRLSSYITEIVDRKHYYDIHNESGSVYSCPKHGEGFSMILAEQYNILQQDLSRLNAKIDTIDASKYLGVE